MLNNEFTNENDQHLQDLYKNSGRTLATQRKSRVDEKVNLRKKRREEFFNAKRTDFEGRLNVGPLDTYEPYTLYDDQVTEGIFSEDPQKIDFSLMVYVARLEKEPEKGQQEFWDMMSYNVLSGINKILQESELNSHQQFLIFRIFSCVSEDSDVAVAITEGTEILKYILHNFVQFDEKCMGEILLILSNTISISTIPNTSDDALFLIDKCKRLCYNSIMSHIRQLAALVVTKVVESIEDDDGIQLPLDLVDFASDLIVSDEVRLRVSGYCLLNLFFCNYRMGNQVVSSKKWLPALERCMIVEGNEHDELFYLLENLCNFMLTYELQSVNFIERMWYIIEETKFQNTERQLRALGVLTELTVSSQDKMQSLLDSNQKSQQILADLLVNAKFDIRKAVLLMLRNLFLNLQHSIPILAGKKTIEGISDLLTVMHPDVVILALECLKAILEYGGAPANNNGNDRTIGDNDYKILIEEANVHTRLDFLVSSPNEQVALLALEILHSFIDTQENDADLPDDLKNINDLHVFNF